MLRLLRWILTGDGHKHEWVWLKTVKTLDQNDFVAYYRVVHMCEVCGKYRQQKLGV